LKVLFIYPPNDFPVFTERRELSPPLGILFLAAVAKGENHDVRVVDMRLKDEKPNEIRRYVDSFQPDIVGISGMTTEYPSCLKIAASCKKVKPDTITVIGGPHVTFTAEEVLGESEDLDIVVRGEGEHTFLKLLDALSWAPSLDEVEGITFRHRGKIVSTGQKQLIDNLDDLPYPARDLVSLKDYTYVTMIGSRGCPYRCTFCSTRLMWGSRYRARSPCNIVNEMQHISEKLGFHHIVFSDDNFTFDQARAKKICKEIIRRRLDVNWSCSARVDNFDRELLQSMKKAGCDEIYLGIESGNQKTLDMVKKDLSVETIGRAVKMLKEEEVIFTASFIIGFPWENENDILETLRFAKEVDPKRVQFHFPVPYPGTEFRRDVSLYGSEIKLVGWEYYHASTPIVKTRISDKLLQLLIEGIQMLSDDHTIIHIL
jgi:radical SAM superfamily enzyme YgiQ (UPF0313 family)